MPEVQKDKEAPRRETALKQSYQVREGRKEVFREITIGGEPFQITATVPNKTGRKGGTKVTIARARNTIVLPHRARIWQIATNDSLEAAMQRLHNKPPTPEHRRKVLTTPPKTEAEAEDFLDALFEDSEQALDVLSRV